MPASAPSPADAVRWTAFSAAPHRMLFFGGALQLVLVMLWWLTELLGRYANTGLVPPPVIPATWAHALLMLYGMFPFFVFGFLLTVYPRWMGGQVVAQRAYVTIFALLTLGWLTIYAGLFVGRVWLAVGILGVLAGWSVALYQLLTIYARAASRGPHEHLLNLALIAGLVGLSGFLAGVVTGQARLYALARDVALWLFLVPVVFSVAHRMIPFFSQSVLANYRLVRPGWSLPLVTAGVLAHLLLDTAGLAAWRFVVDLPLALIVLHHAIAWQFWRSFQVRLLAMLYIAFLWLALAMLLFAIDSLSQLVAHSSILGRAPLHALGIGFASGMIVAMASRVTLGHSGRPLIADRRTWWVLLGLNATAVVRIAVELVPAYGPQLNVVAALAWLACVVPWARHYAPMYLRARADGRPG